MRITSLEEYGLRCALQLAKNKLKGQKISASQVAELEGLSVEYVSKIMHIFKKGGIIESTRGIQGGFTLIKAPAELSLKEVLDSLAHTQKAPESMESFCLQHGGLENSCIHKSECSIRPIWTFVFDVFDGVLNSITLADLLEGSAIAVKKIQQVTQQSSLKLEQITTTLNEGAIVHESI